MTLNTQIHKLDEDTLRKAAQMLQQGKLVAFPTETVYGLGGDATNDHAVARIFEAKGRPSFNPLIVHAADLSQISRYAEMTECARRLAERFWPGPMTLVLPKKKTSGLSHLISAGLDTVAVRIPAHAGARKWLQLTDRPVAAPSANRSGYLSPTTATHVAAGLSGRIDMILDGGPCHIGLESTVLDACSSPPTLLRSGGVSVEDVEQALGVSVPRMTQDEERPSSPGMLLSHYAPGLPLRMNVTVPLPGEAFLGFGPDMAPPNLSESGNLIQAAANLFRILHELDEPEHHTGIAVAPVPETGLGLAINDRLRRASRP